jgi:hypothetical protein
MQSTQILPNSKKTQADMDHSEQLEPGLKTNLLDIEDKQEHP